MLSCVYGINAVLVILLVIATEVRFAAAGTPTSRPTSSSGFPPSTTVSGVATSPSGLATSTNTGVYTYAFSPALRRRLTVSLGTFHSVDFAHGEDVVDVTVTNNGTVIIAVTSAGKTIVSLDGGLNFNNGLSLSDSTHKLLITSEKQFLTLPSIAAQANGAGIGSFNSYLDIAITPSPSASPSFTPSASPSASPSAKVEETGSIFTFPSRKLAYLKLC